MNRYNIFFMFFIHKDMYDILAIYGCINGWNFLKGDFIFIFIYFSFIFHFFIFYIGIMNQMCLKRYLFHDMCMQMWYIN